MKFDKTLDVKGLVGRRASIITFNTLEHMLEGEKLRVITNDIAMRESISSNCDSLGYKLLETKEDEGILSFIIQK
ncbi:sulfur transfer protein SirA [bacterium BMS3Abin07]|nr:sulfur transfer protein SirA [bacterium BMS3Abin07]GBE32727.1 sulfur transfer protein SirA [bacterium BMS3Bbin05]